MTSGYKVRCTKCKIEYHSTDRAWEICKEPFCLLLRHAFGGAVRGSGEIVHVVDTEEFDDMGKRRNRNKASNIDYDREIVLPYKKRKLEKVEMIEVKCEEDKHVFQPHGRSYADDDYGGYEGYGYRGGGYTPPHNSYPASNPINHSTPGARWNVKNARWEVPLTLKDGGESCKYICGTTGICTTECEAMKDNRSVLGDDDIPVLH